MFIYINVGVFSVYMSCGTCQSVIRRAQVGRYLNQSSDYLSVHDEKLCALISVVEWNKKCYNK